MEVELKQRLVGASVIIALAVIFIPMIFENTQDNQNQSITIEIPDEPTGLKHKILNIDTSQIITDEHNSDAQINSKQINNIQIPQSNLDVGKENTQPIITQEKIIDMVDNSVIETINPITNIQEIKPEQVDKEQVDKEQVDKEQVDKEQVDKEQVDKEPIDTKPIDQKPVNKIPEPSIESHANDTDSTYRVKFGVFSQEKNAQQLKAKIINAGFSAIVEKDELKQTYKVFSKQLNSKLATENLSKSIQKLKLNIGKPVIETLTEDDRLASEMLLDTGWIIQIGIFSSKVNSIKLRDKIRNKGFVSFVDEIKDIKKQTRYRVRIGPYATRDEAQAELKNIKIKMDLKGLIKPHEKQRVI